MQFTTNSFTLTDPSLTPIGVAISPVTALINHSCQPNAVVVFPRASSVFEAGRNPIDVVAIRDLLPGEEIFTSYIDVSLPHRHRARELKERYMFDCTCPLCTVNLASDNTKIDPREIAFCGKQGCDGVIKLSDDLDSNDLSKRGCIKCGKSLSKEDAESVIDSIRLGEEALEKATMLELEDSERALKYTCNLIPILNRHLPPTSHPLLALLRLHQSLLITRLSLAISNLPPPSQTQSYRLPQKEVDEVCWAACRALSGIMGGVFPEGHPIRGIALAEIGKLLTVDIEPDEDSPQITAGQTFLKSLLYLSPSYSSTTNSASAFPSGVARLQLALEVLLRARVELKRGFGGEGGEVARQVEDGIRNVEIELMAWKRVVAQGGKLIGEDGRVIES
ncbi:hypothetical protein FRC02_002421 [Tulasnella sp. 418]|nr:hypothetical protein FRC02_002421 [Tulasnella sp. 418]